MHIANGNMGKSGKGKGKAVLKGQEKGKSSNREPVSNERNEQDAYEVAAAVRMVLPEAARIRMQSTLMQSEWPVPVHIHQTLSSQGGIALVPKEYIAEVIGRVGYTSHPTAIVVTQDPDTLGLKGYVRHRIRCTISVMGQGGERTETQIERLFGSTRIRGSCKPVDVWQGSHVNGHHD